MEKKERNIFTLIEEALKAHGAPADEKTVELVRDKMYAELKYQIDPRELQEEIRTGKSGKVTLTAFKIVGNMLRSGEIKKPERRVQEARRTKVDRTFLEYQNMKRAEKIVADTMIMLGAEPTKKDVKNITERVYSKLMYHVNPKEIEKEVKTGRPGPIKYAAYDIINEMKRQGSLKELSEERLEKLKAEEKKLKEALKKPRMLAPGHKKARRK